MSTELITKLAPNEVFCFGSNRGGFHGAGTAGYAMRGTASNTWRTDETFLRAMRAPVGHPDRVGRWAVYGVAKGLQVGREGMSYGIVTIERPGLRRSTPLTEIGQQFLELFAFCRLHDEWSFLMTPVGSVMAGYSAEEMSQTFWGAIEVAGGCPHNLVVPDGLYA